MRDSIEDFYREGDLARAYELCRTSLAVEPEDVWTQHRAVLCLIKSGALERAWTLFNEFGLNRAVQDEDCLSIAARLHKARAFEVSGEGMPALAREAADRYANVFSQTCGHYPAINAASLYLAAGEPDRARSWARRVLDMRRYPQTEHCGEAAYYRGASEAEAYLLLGDVNAARLSLVEAISKDPGNLLAQATTRGQLRWVSAQLGLADDAISWPALPRPLHYAGHLFEQDALGSEGQIKLTQALNAFFDQYPTGPAFGALAAGADILVAEAVLRCDRPLHLVLPVPVDVFLQASVSPYGEAWLRRAHDVLDQASEVLELSSDRRILSPTNLNFASNVAMGLARMRADLLATRPLQLLLCDPAPPEAAAMAFGTHRDAATWQEAGLEQCRVEFKRKPLAAPSKLTDSVEQASLNAEGFVPAMRAMLFVDVANSTVVPDDRVSVFVSQVLGALVESLEKLERSPNYRDSWGDGLFLAFEHAGEAAAAATRLQQVFAGIDQNALGLPESLELRIGAHFGPVHLGEDPLQKRLAPFGAQVAIASRVERAALPGAIFTTEAFAAVLTMEEMARFKCEYIGRRTIDRNLPEMPLYALRAIAADSLDALSSGARASFL